MTKLARWPHIGSRLSNAAAKSLAAGVSLFGLVAAVVGIVAVHGPGKWALLGGVGALALAYGAYYLGKSRSSEVRQSIGEDTERAAVGIFPNQSDAVFLKVVRSSIARSTHMAFIGLGLAVLSDYQFYNELFERACIPGVEVKICFVNPYGKNVISRIADEHVKLLAQPEIGPLGLRRRVNTLLGAIARFQRQGRVPNIEVSLYDQYPTCSIFVFDETVFVFFYGHNMTGHISPVLELSGTSSLGAYFRRNATDILDSAVPADDIIRSRRQPGIRKREWQAAGVYFVPAPESAIYVTLSELLGWDIWAGQPTNMRAEYRSLVPDPGAARYYGAHVTIVDGLYFVNTESLERIERELELLAEQYVPFNARLGKLITEHRGAAGLAIDIDDFEGGFELLHHELLDSAYRVSITSEFLTTITEEDLRRYRERDQRAVAQYGSPYVMSRYKPHFTLSRGLPADGPERKRFLEIIEVERRTIRPEFRIDRIVLARRRADSKYWSIADGDVFTLRGSRSE